MARTSIEHQTSSFFGVVSTSAYAHRITFNIVFFLGINVSV